MCPYVVGFAETRDGCQVWMTELEAEYSEGLCDAIAAAYSEALKGVPRNSAPKRTALELEGGRLHYRGSD